jgi:hypothetical protein
MRSIILPSRASRCAAACVVLSGSNLNLIRASCGARAGIRHDLGLCLVYVRLWVTSRGPERRGIDAMGWGALLGTL